MNRNARVFAYHGAQSSKQRAGESLPIELLAMAAEVAARRLSASGPDYVNKTLWERAGVRFLKAIARTIPGGADVRFCAGGPAVDGEPILHSDALYVMLCSNGPGNVPAAMYRTCSGRKDYTGGPNQWSSISQLAGRIGG